MNRMRIAKLIILAVVIGIVVWVANNTYWVDTKIPSPWKGEAANDPFYAARKFSEKVGATAELDKTLTTLNSNAVMFVSSWNWGLSTQRSDRMKRWVESGGRLVTDRSLVTGSDDFEKWSGIARMEREKNKEEEEEEQDDESDNVVFTAPALCQKLQEDVTTSKAGIAPRTFSVCPVDRVTYLTSRRKPTWILRDPDLGIQAVRVNVGRGSVTLINARPFRFKDFFEGDHPALFAAATQLRGGDEIHFLSEQEQPTLLALTWRYGSPVVMLFLAFIGLALWRGSMRFGPLVAATESARRSLAEQIRGTGQFTMRFGGGQALHGAAVRSLKEAATRRISAYERMPSEERVATLSRLTGFDADKLAAAINYSGARRANELRSAIALLEAARRRILSDTTTKAKHGN